MRTIFFYGLFMDEALLAQKGLHPTTLGRAVLPEFRIHIGDRATLVPSAGSRAYGVVMQLAADEVRSLYSEPSVSEYEPVAVRVRFLDSAGTVDADCYNVPPPSGHAGANPAYVVQLSELVRELGFDSGYADEIAEFAAG
jgi:hypothetical protein